MKNWKKVLLSPETPILEALKVIDKGSLQIAIVIDADNHLKGTVTDGDVRRGILRGISLDKPVREVMNPTPTVAQLNEGRENILTLMRSKELRHIPVVDESGVIVTVEFLEELIQIRKRDNWVVLMAGGVGSRLRPLTDACPKPLLKVGSKPILETIIENFAEYGFHRFFLSVNYKAEMLKEYFGNGSQWGIEISYLHEKRAMGTAGPLGLLPERPAHPFLVMNGDLLTKVNFQQLLDYHKEHTASATMCVREYTFQVPYGVAKLDNHRLLDIEEKPVHRSFVSAGIYVLEPHILDLVPVGDYYDMPDLFKQMIARKLEVTTFPIREYWLDIGRMDDLERAKGEYPEAFK